ncbi:hypothetical protein ACFLU2_01885 [Chloroflexota bacterium]
MIRVKRYLVIVLAVVVLTMLLGCNSKEQELFWAEIEEWGQFSTNNLERAQNEVPFRITIPTYLPDKISKYPEIKGSLLEQWSEKNAFLEIIYRHTEDFWEGIIWIEEYNFPMRGPDPELNPGYSYVEIAGIDVIETEHNLTTYESDGEMGVLWGYRFYWNQENIYFVASIYGYEHSEAIKVVKSMIRQNAPTDATLKILTKDRFLE